MLGAGSVFTAPHTTKDTVYCGAHRPITSSSEIKSLLFMKQHLPLVSFAFINSHLYANSKFTLGTSTRSSLHPKQRGGAGAFDSSEKEIHALRRVSEHSHTLLRT